MSAVTFFTSTRAMSVTRKVKNIGTDHGGLELHLGVGNVTSERGLRGHLLLCLHQPTLL